MGMMDREKVISDIEQQIRWIEEIECHKFPGWLNVTNAMRDAIELLKKQDATTFKPHYIDEYSKHFICGVECGACHKEISSTYHYCPYCGRSVKWE